MRISVHGPAPILIALLLVAAPARAQTTPTEGWRIDFAPMYFWATSLSGSLSAGPASLPIGLDFSDAKDNLGGAFSFHVEVGKGRWTGFSDLNFLRLETDTGLAVGPVAAQGRVELENAIFEAGGGYTVHEPSALTVVAGIRAYTLAPTISVQTQGGAVTPVDASETSPNGFVGLTVRPRLSRSWFLLARADIGAGDARLTWSAAAGLGFRVTSWGALGFGYKALGIDVERDDVAVRRYDVVHHGPYVGFDLHFGGQ